MTDCDQCRTNGGLKLYGGSFPTREKFPAKFSVSVQGAIMNLCDGHKNVLIKHMKKIAIDVQFEEIEK